MPSQPLDTGWGFGSVIDLIDSDVHDIGSPTLQAAARPKIPALQDGGVRLGSFSKLFESLGFPESAPLPPLDPDSELSNSDEALLPSPTFETVPASTIQVDSADDQPIDNAGWNKNQRRKARRRAEKEQKEKEEEQNRQRVMQETLDQIANEHNEKAQQDQQLALRKQLDDVAVASTQRAAETPCKPARTHSKSKVGSKIRPTSPSPVVVIDKSELPSTEPKQPRTPKTPRPSILKRPSSKKTATPQVAQQAPAIPPIEPTPIQAQDTKTSGTLTLKHTAQLQLFQPTTTAPTTSPGQHGLVPRTVRPVTVSRASQPQVQAPITPTPSFAQPVPATTPTRRPTPGRLTIRSQVDRHFHLFNRLLNTFPDDRKWLLSPMQLLNEKSAAHGLHIFVDASNIMIGLKDMLRRHGLQHNAYDMSFDSLALLMERRRPVAKRFFAGSHRESNPLPHVTKLFETSKAVGYDSVMQEQVLIVREDSEKKKFFDDVKKMGWYKANQLRSGSGSDSETGPPPPQTPSAPKWVEQGVDEILHLKMCQSILDTEVPSTMVLATGDGAVAEMSDGFLAHVERALKRGWKVELVSWGQQINGGYRKRQFRAKWAEQFTIVELDEFLEDLIDTP